MTWWPRSVSVVLLLGGMVSTAQTRSSSTLDIYWTDVEGGAATLIVNPTDEAECEGHWLKASVNPDGRGYLMQTGGAVAKSSTR